MIISEVPLSLSHSVRAIIHMFIHYGESRALEKNNCGVAMLWNTKLSLETSSSFPFNYPVLEVYDITSSLCCLILGSFCFVTGMYLTPVKVPLYHLSNQRDNNLYKLLQHTSHIYPVLNLSMLAWKCTLWELMSLEPVLISCSDTIWINNYKYTLNPLTILWIFIMICNHIETEKAKKSNTRAYDGSWLALPQSIYCN